MLNLLDILFQPKSWDVNDEKMSVSVAQMMVPSCIFFSSVISRIACTVPAMVFGSLSTYLSHV